MLLRELAERGPRAVALPFGTDGVVDLYDGLDQPRPSDGEITNNSPPIVVGDVVVVGAALRTLAPSQSFVAGFVRGYDVRSGKRVWIFHTIPRPGEFGNETWEKESWSYTGNTGAWAPMSADVELGYVYVPVETPTNDAVEKMRQSPRPAPPIVSST